MITNEMRDKLIAMAREASQNAYVPYSHFKVGAAILGEWGGIFTGCNVENLLEPEPQLLTAIMEAVHDPRLRICLDLGHANTCASALPPEDWLRACAPYLSHVHLHNNQGDRDLHAALFDGVMDIAGLLSLLEALSPQATCTLELTQDRPSLDWLVEKHLLE